MHIMHTISMPRKQTASSELHLQNHLQWNVYYKQIKIIYAAYIVSKFVPTRKGKKAVYTSVILSLVNEILCRWFPACQVNSPRWRG